MTKKVKKNLKKRKKPLVIKSNNSNAAILEINSETDFVAKDENFINFSNAIIELLIEQDVKDIKELSVSSISVRSNSYSK